MEASLPSQTSLVGLIRNLTEDTKKLLRQEVELAKAELSEKLAVFGKNAASVAVGGFIAYAGFIVLLIGLGWLAAWGLQKAGLQPVLAGFIGLAAVGVVIIAVGTVLLMQGLKSFSKESLAPQRTIYTIQRLKGSEPQPITETKPEAAPPKPSSEEIKIKVVATEDRMTGAIGELGERMRPGYINAQVKDRIQERPYRSGLIAIAAGLVSGLFITRVARRS